MSLHDDRIMIDGKEPQNVTIGVPLQAFMATMRAIRQIRELHKPWHFGPEGVLCQHCSHPANVCEVMVQYPCPTLQTLEALDTLEEDQS